MSGNARRFAVIALLSLGVDFLAFQILFGMGYDIAAAHIASFTAAAIFYCLLNAPRVFAVRPVQKEALGFSYLKLFTIFLMALFLRGGVLSVANDMWGLPAETAILFGIVSSAIVTYVGSVFYVFPSRSNPSPGLRWRMIAIGIVLYALALRLAFLGSVDLVPEEAYYWNYAQHLDIGYLDHPPMVAWLIWLSTSLLHNTEFAVRIGAYLCWLVAAFFCFLLARNLYGKTAAFIAVLLFAGLPFFFVNGMLMTPDAPLTAAWAGALFFLERALLGEQRTAWASVGVCVGLGLLSKYTIVLLGPAAILFMLIDSRSRRWFRRRSPYIAVLIAVVLFTPVIVWNAEHDWVSFIFQGPQRFTSPLKFSLFNLLGSIQLLLTPVGFIAVVVALTRQAKTYFRGPHRNIDQRALFVATFTIAPFSVFLFFSLFHGVKLDWTGALWLAMLPLLAADIAEGSQVLARWSDALRRTWGPALAVMLLAYGAALHYLALGLPGIGYSDNLARVPIAWKVFGRQAALIDADLESATGHEPLRVGMDKEFLSSEMAFYDPVDNDGATNTAGRSLFGFESLMYDYWFPAARQRGRNVILFALNSGDLSDRIFAAKFSYLGPIRNRILYKKAVRAGQFYYRVGYNFHAD